jgi:division/cell wall cluster transcriptional repressor MraZ
MEYNEYDMKVDSKGRAGIPKEVRESLLETFGTDELVVTRMQRARNKGLYAFPAKEFSKWEAALLAEKPSAQKSAMLTLIQLRPVVSFDQLGRIQLPRRLRSHANLDGNNSKDIVIITKSDRLEIWETATHDNVINAAVDKLGEDPEFAARFDEY